MSATQPPDNQPPEPADALGRKGFVGSPLFAIFIIVAVDVFGFTLILPLLPFYAKSEPFLASDFTVGLLAASYALCQLVAGPILGRISDRVGRKKVLIVSQIGTLIGFLILGFANTLWLLFLSRIIDGLTAGNLSIAQAYISDVTAPENRTKAFGLIGIAFGGGFLLGPAISGFLSTYGYHYPAFAAALLSLTSIFCTWKLLPTVPIKLATAVRIGKSRLEGFTRYFVQLEPRRRLMEFFFFTLSFSLIVGGGLALFLGYRFGYDAQETGYLYAFSGLIGGVIQGGLIGRLAKRLGEEKLATIGFVSMAGGYLLLGVSNSLPMLLLVVVISSFGSAVTRPSLTTLITKSVGPDEQGEALGVSQSLASIAQTIGPVVAGWLIGHNLLFVWAATAAAAALAGASFGFSRRKNRDVPQVAQ